MSKTYDQNMRDLEQDLYSLKADYSRRLDDLRELLLEISKGGQAHAECTDRTSPTGLRIQELCK